jgi:hypothetical protein
VDSSVLSLWEWGFGRLWVGSAAFAEEGAEEAGAFVGEDAGGDGHLVVEAGMVEDLEDGTGCAGLGIGGSANEAAEAGVDHGAGAHGAGFEGDIEAAVEEAVVADGGGGGAEGDHLGVGGGVAVAEDAILAAREDFAVADDDGADGDFAGVGGGAGFSEGLAHKFFVGGAGHGVRPALRSSGD